MDPLSITASTITLIQATGFVATALGNIVRALKTVDMRLTSLCNELSNLKGLLGAIDSTLKGCQKFDLSLVDEGLWRQSEVALANCQTNLNELGLLVNKIKDSSRHKGFRWKARAVVDLNIYGDDLVACRDKIDQSNSALQTMLHAITVSLSLKNSTSQDLIIKELDKLKASIYKALHTASRPVGGFFYTQPRESDARISRNLRLLAEAAKRFHTSASSTAGTVRSDSSDAPWQSYPGAGSLFGDFPLFRRERVEQFLDNHTLATVEPQVAQPIPSPGRSGSRASSTPSLVLDANPHKFNANLPDGDDEGDEDDEDLEQAFLNGLRALATASIKNADYSKAIGFLQQAMAPDIDIGNNAGEYRQIQIQLAVCYFLQGRWRLAEPVVRELATLRANQDMAVCNLLHALALRYLLEFSFDDAIATCKRALLAKRRLCKKQGADINQYNETLGLFMTIFDVRGDYIRAEVFRQQLPKDFDYIHPTNEVSFVRFRTDLLPIALGHDPQIGFGILSELDGGTDASPSSQNPDLSRQTTDFADRGSSLRKKLSEHERYELDTAKEVIFINRDSPSDADDEASSISTWPELPSPSRRPFGRFLGSMRLRLAGSGEVSPTSPPTSLETGLSFPNPSPDAFLPVNLGWFKDGKSSWFKKSKTLLRKKTHREVMSQTDGTNKSVQERSFRLLRMHHVATPDGLELGSDEGDYFYSYLGLGAPRDPSMVDRRGYTPSAADGPAELSQECQITPVAHSPDEKQQRAILAPDNIHTRNGVLYMETCRRRRSPRASPPTTQPGNTWPNMSLHNRDVDQDHHSQEYHPRQPGMLSANTTEQPEHDLSAPNGNIPGPTLTTTPEKTHSERVELEKLSLHELIAWFLFGRVSSSVPEHGDKMNASSEPPNVLQEALNQFVTTVLSLRTLQGVDEISSKELELKAPITKLTTLSNDRTLVRDSERLMQALEFRRNSEQLPEDDSGYGSMASTQSREVEKYEQDSEDIYDATPRLKQSCTAMPDVAKSNSDDCIEATESHAKDKQDSNTADIELQDTVDAHIQTTRLNLQEERTVYDAEADVFLVKRVESINHPQLNS